jgi:hypothetical protein
MKASKTIMISAALVLMLTAVLFTCSGINVEAATEGNVSAQSSEACVTKDGNTYQITGITNNTGTVIYNSYGEQGSDATIPASIIVNGEKMNVTGIMTGAFSGTASQDLKTITIRSRVIDTISKDAFSGLSKDTIIYVPNSKLKVYKALIRASGASNRVEAADLI